MRASATYDYVIVGAGSAGCVLAARLTEHSDTSVLLIEAGPPDSNESIHVPAAFGSLFKTEVDWDYSTAPEPHCDGRRIYLPRGKMLGGSSAMNAMIWIRGNPRDYDGWRDQGNPGWGYADLLPYFMRAEDNERGPSALHGAGGPLAVSDGRSNNPIMRAFVEAAQQLGIPYNQDLNGPVQDGVGYYQVNQRNGRRCSAATGYLHPAMDRPNLHVKTRTLVQTILVEAGRAVGVACQRFDESERFDAEREVILCAGAYNSPQILLLSGIGPAAHLQSRLIDVVHDLPGVGGNLQDHPFVGAAWTTEEPVSLMGARQVPENLAAFEEGRGPLTSNIGEAGGFVGSRPDLEAPDLQFNPAPVLFVDEGLAEPTEHGCVIAICLIAPRSRGSVRLASADPTAKPVVRYDFYADDADVEAMAEGLRMCVKLGGQPAMTRYCQTPYRVPASDSDEDVRAHIRRYTQTLYHPVGTCRMGIDDLAVVDSELRIRGVEALRVVDASIMPTITRGNTHAPTVAIAERGADLIRG